MPKSLKICVFLLIAVLNLQAMQEPEIKKDFMPKKQKTSKKLSSYRKKRDFSKTPEPHSSAQQKQVESAVFVIHKHAASHLHYDLRLEIDGVLTSWAVPKGPSTDPSVKRLAVLTEDHPLSYLEFEGVIPQGQYGGGTVMVWDIGTYRNLKSLSMAQSFKKGRIEVELLGKKLHGNYALVRMGTSGKNWLLIKMRDEYADKKIKQVTKSALTGRTMKQIADE